MDTREVINNLVSKYLDEHNQDYCSSCMGGCDNLTKFLCLGHKLDDVNQLTYDINGVKITRKNVMDYLDVRDEGLFNMITDADTVSKLIKVDSKKYMEIQKNFNELLDYFILE